MKRPVWCAAFLVALEAQRGNVSRAADFVGIDRSVVYDRRHTDARFASDMDAVYVKLARDLVSVVRVTASPCRRPAA